MYEKVLPACDDGEVVAALSRVVTAGRRLGEQPSHQDKLGPLLYMAAVRSHEFFPDVAARVLDMLDRSLIKNSEEALGGHEAPLLSIDKCRGFRILLGLHPDYGDQSVDIRRVEAASLLFPEHSREWKAEAFAKTWEKPALRLVVECLRASYGQEPVAERRRHESVHREIAVIVGKDRQIEEVLSKHASRSMLSMLDTIRTRFTCRERADRLTRVDFEAVAGVGAPEIIQTEPWIYVIHLPLIVPVGLGELTSWSYRRRYIYRSNAPVADMDWTTLTGNVRGFTIAAEVRFQSEPPPIVWRFDIHSLRQPGSPAEGQLLEPGSDGSYRFYPSTDTFPDRAYGIAWSWNPPS